MKKILLTVTSCLLMAASVSMAQDIQPCGTYQAREIYLKTVPGYAAKLNAAEAQSAAEYQAFLKQAKNSRTSSIIETYTVPVVFHILHLGEPIGTGSNINDADCVASLVQINKDYSRNNSDTTTIDPHFKPMYEDAHMKFMLAQKDPKGNCTTGIVHHYDPKSVWDQSDYLAYQYSTVAAGNWNPSKYLNIYIVKSIAGGSGTAGTIIGYTHLPGTAPISAADAIVYRGDNLTGLAARSLSHEIGHWFGLSHTFGSTNNPGYECGNDDIDDTPATTGFFSTCPKAALYPNQPTVTNPLDSSDIVKVMLGIPTNSLSLLTSTTLLNSSMATMSVPLLSLVATTVTPATKTGTIQGKGVTGSYSDFTDYYGNDFNAGSTNSISIKSIAKSTDNNYVKVYIDYNRDGDFIDANETVFSPTVAVDNYSVVPIANAFGTRTFGTPVKINKTYTVSVTTGTVTTINTLTTTPDSFKVVPSTIIFPTGIYGLVRMRVITSDAPIISPIGNLNNGEFEDYMLNIGKTLGITTTYSTNNQAMASCDNVRPNIENIMDYSACPKMFTKGQVIKMRTSAASAISSRDYLVSMENLYNVGILGTKTVGNFTMAPVSGSTVVTTYTVMYSNPTTVSPCAPIADFFVSKVASCQDQSVTYNSTSFNNSSALSYSWIFEGGTPSVSTLASQAVVYSNAGTHSTTLTVTNLQGISTKTVASAITTGWHSYLTLPYSEGFESGAWWPVNWAANNPDAGTLSWQLSNYGSNNSTKSLILPNANYSTARAGNIDMMETPSFDFSNTTAINFAFDYSFARRAAVTQDEFKLQYTTDCGGTWTSVTSNALPTTAPSASVMAANTGGTVELPYIPWNSTAWKTANITSSNFTTLNGKRDVKFRFYFQNDLATGQSQNLYIDNINITGTVGLHEFENSLGLSIYPNPTNVSSIVEFTSPIDAKATILVYDVTGRVIEESSQVLNSGIVSKYAVNASNKLNSGIYFVTIIINNNKITKKLIIE